MRLWERLYWICVFLVALLLCGGIVLGISFYEVFWGASTHRPKARKKMNNDHESSSYGTPDNRVSLAEQDWNGKSETEYSEADQQFLKSLKTK